MSVCVTLVRSGSKSAEKSDGQADRTASNEWAQKRYILYIVHFENGKATVIDSHTHADTVAHTTNMISARNTAQHATNGISQPTNYEYYILFTMLENLRNLDGKTNKENRARSRSGYSVVAALAAAVAMAIHRLRPAAAHSRKTIYNSLQM